MQGRLDAGQSEFLKRVTHQLQVPLREMKILGRGLQIFVSEQNLNRAPIGSGFQQLRGPTMP